MNVISRHFLLFVGLGALLIVLSTVPAQACVACYGQSDSPLAEGMNMGILFLLGCIGAVLGGFLTFFVFLARRGAAIRATRAAQASAPLSQP